MAEWLPLGQLIAAGPQAARLVQTGPGGRRCHGLLWARAMAWRNKLRAAGCRRCALFVEEPFEFAAALWGGWHAGVTWVLPADRQPATWQQLAGDVDGFVVGESSDQQGFGLSAPRLLQLDGGDELEAGAASAELAALDEDVCQLSILTSGSTGEPLWIVKRLRQLAREVEALEAALAGGGDFADAVVWSTVGHQHIYGLLFRILWPLAAGRSIAERRVVGFPDGSGILVSSPAYFKRLVAPPTRNMAAVFSSGGPLPSWAADHAEQAFGVAPIEIYGSTETGGIAFRRGDAPWQPLPAVVFKVSEGRLAVQSPHLADPGWYVTTDRAEACGDGFRLLGRVDRIVKVEEKRVSLAALEQCLCRSGWIDGCRAVVLSGARQILAVACVLSAKGASYLTEHGVRALNERLREVVMQQFELVVVPRRWLHVEALPSNEHGKVTERGVRALFEPAVLGARWLLRNSYRAMAELDVAHDLPVLAGHFPRAPILAGVVQIDWAVRLARQAFELTSDVVRLEAVRFRKVIVPKTTLRLMLQWQHAGGRLAFEWLDDNQVATHGAVIFSGGSEDDHARS